MPGAALGRVHIVAGRFPALRRRGHHDVGLHGEQGDGRQVLGRVEGHVGIDRRIDRVRRGVGEQRVAVGADLGDLARADQRRRRPACSRR